MQAKQAFRHPRCISSPKNLALLSSSLPSPNSLHTVPHHQNTVTKAAAGDPVPLSVPVGIHKGDRPRLECWSVPSACLSPAAEPHLHPGRLQLLLALLEFLLRVGILSHFLWPRRSDV